MGKLLNKVDSIILIDCGIALKQVPLTPSSEVSIVAHE